MCRTLIEKLKAANILHLVCGLVFDTTAANSGCDKGLRTFKDFDGNMARYTANSVTCKWAGAVFKFEHLDRYSEAKDRKKMKKVTNRPTDSRTKQVV